MPNLEGQTDIDQPIKRLTWREQSMLNIIARFGVAEYGLLRKTFYKDRHRRVGYRALKKFRKLGLIDERRMVPRKIILRLKRSKIEWLADVLGKSVTEIEFSRNYSTPTGIRQHLVQVEVGLKIESLDLGYLAYLQCNLKMQNEAHEVKLTGGHKFAYYPDLEVIHPPWVGKRLLIDINLGCKSKNKIKGLIKYSWAQKEEITVLFLCGSDYTASEIDFIRSRLARKCSPTEKIENESKVLITNYEELLKSPLTTPLRGLTSTLTFEELSEKLSY